MPKFKYIILDVSKLSTLLHDEESGELFTAPKYNTDGSLFVHIISDQTKLENGFRYIKELLLQHHNFKMFKAFEILKSNNILVFSVKTDCFTIKKQDLEKVKTLLEFDNGIGTWRTGHSGNDICFPTIQLTPRKAFQIQVETRVTIQLQLNDEWDTAELCDMFEKYKIIIYENNSTDATKNILQKYIDNDSFKIIMEDIPEDKIKFQSKAWAYTEITGSDHPCRMEQIANARNKIIEECKKDI